MRYREKYPLDSAEVADGDIGFLGVNAKENPELLPEHWLAAAENMQFPNACAETRGGLVTPVQFNHRLREVKLADCEGICVKVRTDQAINGGSLNVRAVISGPTAFISGGSQTVSAPGGTVSGIGTMTGQVLLGVSNRFNSGSVDEVQVFVAVQISTATERPQSLLSGGQEIRVRLYGRWDGAGNATATDGKAVIEVEQLVSDPTTGVVWSGVSSNPCYTAAGSVVEDATTEIGWQGNTSVQVTQGHDEAICEIVVGASEVKLRYAASAPFAREVGGSDVEPAEYAEAVERITGAGVYSDVYGAEWLLVATPQGVWRSREDRGPELIACSDAPGDTVTFRQLGGRVLMLRGEGSAPLWWDGSRETTFDFLPNVGLEDGTKVIPPLKRAEAVASARIIAARGADDEVIFSDILSPDRYDETLSVRVASGAHGRIQRLWPLMESAVVVFKEQGIFMLENVEGDLSGVTAQEVNQRIGLVAPEAVAQIGAEVFFLSRSGVYRLTQVLERRLTTSAQAVSEPIAPLLEQRVNWTAVQTACAGVEGEYFTLALPVDGATLPNAVARYDTRKEAWEGLWVFPDGITISALVPVQWLGRTRLAAVDSRNGYVYLLNEAHGWDYVGRDAIIITSSLTTRAFGARSAMRKRWRRVGITAGTLAADSTGAQYALSVKADGVAESQAVGPQPRVWLNSRSHLSGRGARNMTNADDDQQAAWWEDYIVTAVAGASGAEVNSGLATDRRQDHTERATCNVKGRTLQVSLSVTKGSARVTHVGVEAVTEDRQPRAQQ